MRHIATALLLAIATVHCTFGTEVGVSLFSEKLSSNIRNITILSESNVSRGAGEGIDCRSNNTQSFNDQTFGNWTDPNGAKLINDINDPFYVLRRPGAIGLYRTDSLQTREGIYTCEIPDSNGILYTQYIGLYTNDNFNNGKPVFHSQPTFKLQTSLSKFPPSFSLTCTSSEFPPTYVNWTKDNIPINVSNNNLFSANQVLIDAKRTMFDNVLQVNGAEDDDTLEMISGTYSCQVINSQNMATNTYVVTAPFGPPANITPTFLGSGNVSLSWDPPDGPVYGYQLFYTQANGSEMGIVRMVNISNMNTSVILYGLEAAATYSIQMLAYADLPTTMSEAIEVTLNVAGTPQNIKLTHIPSNATSILVMWNPPNSSSVVGYIINYSPADDMNNCPDDIPGGVLYVSKSNNSAIITGLQENTKYSVYMRTISTAAVGESSNIINITTLKDVPNGPPTNISVITMNPSTINLTWSPPECLYQNGPITGYQVIVDGGRKTEMVNNQLEISLQDLEPFRNLSFAISAMNENGSSTVRSRPVYNYLIGIPGNVIGLSIAFSDITSLTATWQPPRNVEQVFYRLLSYSVTWYDTPLAGETLGTMLGQAIVHANTRYEIENLNANTSYTVYVSAMSSFSGVFSRVLNIFQTKPLERVTGLNVIELNSTSVNVTWNIIPNTQDILYYKIYYNSSNVEEITTALNISSSNSLLPVHNLNNRATYTFYIVPVVNASNGVIEGPSSDIVTFMFTRTDNIQTVLIGTFSAIGALIVLIVVITITVIILLLLNRSIGPQLATKGEEGFQLIPIKKDVYSSPTKPQNGRPSLVETPPADVHAVEGQEVVLRVHFHGNPTPIVTWKKSGKEITDWENVRFLLSKDNDLVFPYVEVEHSGVYEVIGINSHGEERVKIRLTVYPETDLMQTAKDTKEPITSVAVNLLELGQYVASLHGFNNKKFREQFKRLIVPKGTTEVGEDVNNHPFNRNQNILVYDNNRIQLEPLPRFLDCQHDYINASYILGGDNYPRRFIATQGPLDRTITDFWRMIWQEKACAIVMLTKLQEDLRIKCSQYWPNKKSEEFGPFTVTLQKETTYPSYVIREFTLHYNTLIGNLRSKLVNPTGKLDPNKKEYYSAAQSSLAITQYHYTDWVEHASPGNISSLLSFHRDFVNGTSNKKGPIVVHCSNGAGRTGAFITIDIALEQASEESIVDVPSIVAKIREQRMMMIHTLNQYMTVHDAILEQILCGITAIPAQELHSHIHSLSLKKEERNDKDSLITGFESQFKTLQQVSVAPEDAICNAAKHNLRKNRYPSILSTDHWRVPLKNDSPDYINASFVPSYKNKKAFIIAQGPLRETRRDFWKMIFDQEITTVIMLSPLMEGGEEVCGQYWPNEGNIEFGDYLVSVKEEWSHEGFSRKVLFVRDTKNNLMRRLAQFQIDGWSQDGVTSYNIMPIVNTMNLVFAIQRKTPHTPLLVHCSNMIGRSAIFCATMATIDQIKSEGKADIFQTVKAMCVQLPGAIQSKEQYQLIHTLTASFIDIFSTTANF